MHGARITFSDQNLNPNPLVQGTNVHFQQLFKNFLHSFTRDNTRIYQKRLQSQIRARRYVLPVQLSDLRAFDQQLYDRLTASPLQILQVMQNSLETYLKERIQEYSINSSQGWQIVLRSDSNPIRIRDIKSNQVSRLFVVSGIIISTTKPFIKASKLIIQCRSCSNRKYIQIPPGQNPYVPSYCEGMQGRQQKCPKDPFVALPTSEVIDTQYLKIQQFPDEVPTGEVARTYQLITDRKNVSLCQPGDRVNITGVMLVNQTKGDHLSKGYIYVTGIVKLKERAEITYTDAQQETFQNMSKDPALFEKIYTSIAPGIYGNEEIKKAIACMLFGGSRKFLPDNTILRGDINVLLLGDPSTAKSQFLKYVEQTASIAVYTSGKGSSAAGLTASITRDGATGEFQIEGGALVLADGGIVCIDEFDKMKSNDRVAIHEAMEQQTISVAKAGITTRLNSRTSILAAANPIHGRIDQVKMIQEQIDMKSTILSRFDCIFIVRDINNPQNNDRIASHILDLHQGKAIKNAQGAIPLQLFKKYIKYARTKVQPRLSPLASQKLINQYVEDRKKANQVAKIKNTGNPIPVTVRQLQAVIRISQSLARMKLLKEVGLEEVQTAHYLFEISTLKIIEGSQEFGYNLSQGAAEEVQKVEQTIRKRVCVGNQVSLVNLMADLEVKFNHQICLQAINNMVRNKELREIKFRKSLIRQR